MYSMWSGYQQRPAMSSFIKECEDMGLKTVALHTSGHADPDTIRLLIERVQPTEIIPVHTENAGWFESLR